MVFRWVFIPWLQQELDAYRERVNNTAKRRDRNKVCATPTSIFYIDVLSRFFLTEYLISSTIQLKILALWISRYVLHQFGHCQQYSNLNAIID